MPFAHHIMPCHAVLGEPSVSHGNHNPIPCHFPPIHIPCHFPPIHSLMQVRMQAAGRLPDGHPRKYTSSLAAYRTIISSGE